MTIMELIEILKTMPPDAIPLYDNGSELRPLSEVCSVEECGIMVCGSNIFKDEESHSWGDKEFLHRYNRDFKYISRTAKGVMLS